MSWRSLRRLVYAQARGYCQVCLLRVGPWWDAGHLVDRCVGGADTLDNLVLMCVRCNRTEKPIHRTKDEALAWLRQRRRRARTGREVDQDWRPFYQAMYGIDHRETSGKAVERKDGVDRITPGVGASSENTAARQ